MDNLYRNVNDPGFYPIHYAKSTCIGIWFKRYSFFLEGIGRNKVFIHHGGFYIAIKNLTFCIKDLNYTWTNLRQSVCIHLNIIEIVGSD